MKYIKYYILIIIIGLLQSKLQSQSIILNQTFDIGIPGSWKLANEDKATPVNSSFDTAWVQYESPDSTGDFAAASTSFYNPADTSEDYLITPALNLGTFGNLISWDARSLDASYPDGYQILVSTTDRQINSFQDTLFSVNAESPYWNSYQINLANSGFTSQTIYLAFKNNTYDGNALLVNNIKVTTNDASSIQPNISNNLKIYPNPLPKGHQLSIEGLSQSALVNVWNQSGQIVLQKRNIKTNKFDLSKLDSGVYFIEITHTDYHIRKKLIIL